MVCGHTVRTSYCVQCGGARPEAPAAEKEQSVSTAAWNPWHGCKKCSPGCAHCYVYYLDGTRELDASVVYKSKTNFNLPLKKDRAGNYKIAPGTEVYTCFTSDFFIDEADEWRPEAWCQIKERSDLFFLIPTKRIQRFAQCLPEDWGEGYENVAVAVSCENQSKADERIPLLLSAPLKHRCVFASPLLEGMDLTPYLRTGRIESVSVGGESYAGARECRFEWVRDLYRQCRETGTPFGFHQTGSNFVYNGKRYSIPHRKEHEQARKAMAVLREWYKDFTQPSLF